MPCSCGFTTNADNTCNGNHKIVKSVKDSIINNIENVFKDIDDEKTLGLKTLIVKAIRESK
jgi:hypothetical protein